MQNEALKIKLNCNLHLPYYLVILQNFFDEENSPFNGVFGSRIRSHFCAS